MLHTDDTLSEYGYNQNTWLTPLSMKDRFRAEILSVLILKIALLTGLWFVVFRPEGKKPEPQAPIGEHLFVSSPSNTPDFEERKPHDR